MAKPHSGLAFVFSLLSDVWGQNMAWRQSCLLCLSQRDSPYHLPLLVPSNQRQISISLVLLGTTAPLHRRQQTLLYQLSIPGRRTCGLILALSTTQKAKSRYPPPTTTWLLSSPLSSSSSDMTTLQTCARDQGYWNGGNGPGWGPGCPYDPDEADVACVLNAVWLWSWKVRASTFFCREAISVAMPFSCAFNIFALAFLAFRWSLFSFHLYSPVGTSNNNLSTGSGASSLHRDRTSTRWSKSSLAQPFSNCRTISFGIAAFFIPPS